MPKKAKGNGKGKSKTKTKSGRKRSLASSGATTPTFLSNIAGYGDDAGGIDDSLESCMAQLQQQQQDQPHRDITPSKDDERKRRKSKTTTTDTGTESETLAMTSKLNDDDTARAPTILMNERVDVDRIDSWNHLFHDWAAHARYSPGLLPSIDEDLQRHFKVQDLSKFLLQSGGSKQVRMPVFERWLIDSKFEERHQWQPHLDHDDNHPTRSTSRYRHRRKKAKKTSAPVNHDPILPTDPNVGSNASQRLIDELEHLEMDAEQSEKIVRELCRRTFIACQEMISQRDHWNTQPPLKKGDRIELEEQKDALWTILLHRKKWKKPLVIKLNKEHYAKLKSRFLELHVDKASSSSISLSGTSKVSKRMEIGFHVLLITMLLRYSSLSGGQLLQDLRGGGMQGAIHEEVFQALQRHFPQQNGMEGFASPFNVCMPLFASAFPDIEWHFGSAGSFFDCKFREGYCEVNPPFSPALMDGMVKHIEKQLEVAAKHNRILSFIVVVPSADTSGSTNDDGNHLIASAKVAAASSFSKMLSSSFFQQHIKLKAKDHGYIEASQHLRPTKYKQSMYDTSVIVLQSEAAAQAAVDAATFCKDIQQAFQSRHEAEIEQRRKAEE